MRHVQHITLISLSTILCIFCSTPRQIAKKTISHEYFNIDFSPAQIQKKALNGMMITVTPIDAQSLNRETYEAASRDGSYEKEFATEVERKRANLDGLSKDERAMIQSMERALTVVEGLQSEGQIPAMVSNEIKRKIWFGDEYGKIGTEISSLSEIESYPETYNPFKVDKNYLSVIKVVFENKGNEIQKIYQRDFQVISDLEQLSPLKADYFESNLKGSPEKIKNVYRINMPDELTITPNQKIIKYLAFPAISPDSKHLTLQYIQEKSVLDFEFTLNRKSAPKSYTLEPYVIYDPKRSSGYTTEKYVFVIDYDNMIPFSVKENLLWVSEERKNISFSVYGIGYDPRSKSVKFGKIQTKRFSDFTKHMVSVEHKTLKTK